MEELLEFIEEVVDELGVREEVNYVRHIVCGAAPAPTGNSSRLARRRAAISRR